MCPVVSTDRRAHALTCSTYPVRTMRRLELRIDSPHSFFFSAGGFKPHVSRQLVRKGGRFFGIQRESTLSLSLSHFYAYLYSLLHPGQAKTSSVTFTPIVMSLGTHKKGPSHTSLHPSIPMCASSWFPSFHTHTHVCLFSPISWQSAILDPFLDTHIHARSLYVICVRFPSFLIKGGRENVFGINSATRLAGSELLEVVEASVPDVLVTGECARVGPLPERVGGEAGGEGGSGAGSVASDNEGVVGGEGGASDALVPPAGAGVDHGVPACLGLVGVTKVLDPGDELGLAESVAGGRAADRLEVEHTGEGAAVTGPSAAVGKEVVGLGSTAARVRVGKVVSTADQSRVGGTSVLGREARGDVRGSLGSLDDDKLSAVRLGSVEVDAGLVVGDVKALDARRGTLLEFNGRCAHRRGGGSDHKERD